MKTIYLLTFALLATTAVQAQEATEGEKEKAPKILSITPDGMYVSDKYNPKQEKKFDVEFLALDLGVNSLDDKTDYTSAEAKQFLNVPGELENGNLFSLRTAKSINVNLWPVIGKWRVLKTEGQKIYLSTGVGLQMYNFRFNKNITYSNVTNPEVYKDSVDFSKNKLGITYLSVPLMLTFKTRLAEKAWLVYGVGATAGYRLDSWTKQVSSARGKKKNHDPFNLEDFNTCLTGEIGLSGYFRLYASYQITALHKYALDQHPFCIGIRFGGV
jgi:hypothetical protein